MRILKRIWWLLLILLILGWVAWSQYPKLTMISGYAAKNMASTVYLAGRDEGSVNADDHRVPLISLANSHYNHSADGAASAVWGMQRREALCREGLGCVLLPPDFEGDLPAAKPRRNSRFDSVAYPYGHIEPRDTVFPEVHYDLLEEALDLAFAEEETQRTRTVLVLYKGHLVRERYISGFGPETRILGWSMTKSVLATLFGILEAQGQLSISQATGWDSWQGDERRDITIEHLLRMQSGLAWEEDYTRISDVTQMLFLKKDMPAVQAAKKALAPPGEVWNYSSGTSNLLSGMLRRQFASHQAYLDFPYRALIDRIGMNSMLLEADLEGNYVGSSYGWASTRDWGRFGQLYLDRGIWQGDTIFRPEWVETVTRPTQNSGQDYGAHFWLNAGGTYPDAPRDMYMANGYQGQHVFIIPSRELVVVRTGLAESPDFNANAFLAAVVAAFPAK